MSFLSKNAISLCSDEEEEGIEENTLMYLPIAPDIEDSDDFSAVADSSSAAEVRLLKSSNPTYRCFQNEKVN